MKPVEYIQEALAGDNVCAPDAVRDKRINNDVPCRFVGLPVLAGWEGFHCNGHLLSASFTRTASAPPRLYAGWHGGSGLANVVNSIVMQLMLLLNFTNESNVFC